MNTLRFTLTILLATPTLFACDSGSSDSSSAVDAAVTADVTQGDAGTGQGDATAQVSDTVADSATGEVDVTSDASMMDTATEDVGAEEVAETDDVEPTEMDVPMGEGACTNDTDMAAIEDFDMMAGQMIGMSCYDAAGGPGQTSAEEIKACFSEKLATEHGFTMDCGACIADQLICLQQNCMDKCMSSMMGGQQSPECTQCMEDFGCMTNFSERSGLNPDVFAP